MSKEPLVTIVTPSYNQGKFIAETIESVLNQTYKNIEYIVIDGGSTDETVDILKSYEDKGVKWISERDDGQSDAINKGFRMAKGEIIGWINSDDLLMPYTVEKIVEAFSDEKVGLVYGNIWIIDETGNFVKEYKPGEITLYRLLKIEQSVPQPGSFYRKRFVEMVGGLNKYLNFVMDYDLFIKLLKISKAVYIPLPLAKFRLHCKSKTFNFSATKSVIEAYKVSRKYGAPLFSPLNFKRAKALAKAIVKSILGMPLINIEKLKKGA
jgi:glycosyltransferase involved in cell wall biosynthesis